MRFSLVVCTYGRSRELSELFASVVRQNRTDIELIVVDQNADDRLADIVSKFAGSFPLKHIRNAGRGASLARNVGINHASGELIGFPDDDCRYLDHYLDAVDQVFIEDLTIGCISGFPTKSLDTQLDDYWQDGRMDLRTTTVLNRCQEFTVFVRKECLGDLRYNEHLGVGSQTLWGADEAPDLLIRLIETGCRIVYFPHLFVYHPDKLATYDGATLRRAAGYSPWSWMSLSATPLPTDNRDGKFAPLRCRFSGVSSEMPTDAVRVLLCDPHRPAPRSPDDQIRFGRGTQRAPYGRIDDQATAHHAAESGGLMKDPKARSSTGGAFLKNTYIF